MKKYELFMDEIRKIYGRNPKNFGRDPKKYGRYPKNFGRNLKEKDLPNIFGRKKYI